MGFGETQRNTAYRFQMSQPSVCRIFHNVLSYMSQLHKAFVQMPTDDYISDKISTEFRYLAFNGCRFVYVLAGAEGSIGDASLVRIATMRNFNIPRGSFFIGDVGFGGIRRGIVSPYTQVRYHLQECSQRKFLIVAILTRDASPMEPSAPARTYEAAIKGNSRKDVMRDAPFSRSEAALFGHRHMCCDMCAVNCTNTSIEGQVPEIGADFIRDVIISGHLNEGLV
ncbi:hypothetical protein E4U10_005750 [Claviceps purpurea]|nr:hypothetical protein E4U10_005750 [Claviceps purpurea]